MGLPDVFTTDPGEARIHAVGLQRLAREAKHALQEDNSPILVIIASGRADKIANDGEYRVQPPEPL